jgi:hypothetical protein
MMSQNEPYEIQIDKEGIWYFRGEEMIRKDIVHYFYEHLKAGEEGSFYIEVDDQRFHIGVEDVPYVIMSVELIQPQEEERPCFVIALTDGKTEILNLDRPLRRGKDNVLYARVRKGEFEARFSRPAYYQLCRYIECDQTNEVYVLKTNHFSVPICFY